MILNFIKGILGISSPSDLRILMYHQVSPEKERLDNEINISAEKLDEQLKYISQNFETVFFKELESKKDTKNKLLITFDDGYYNNLVYLIPLLKKYGLKATIFIPTKLVENDLENKPGLYMSFGEIKSLPPEHVEIALHSHSHNNYAEINLAEAEKDLTANIETLEQQNIFFTKVLAYPYGKFPKKGVMKKRFFELLERKEIVAALRIGNDLTRFPWKNKFEVKRINIKGSDSFSTFRKKLRYGKIKL